MSKKKPVKPVLNVKKTHPEVTQEKIPDKPVLKRRPSSPPSREDDDAAEELSMVINYPYQITGSGKTRIHVCLFKPDFTPAGGAEVRINNEPGGTADSNGIVIFDYVPGSGGSHRIEATLQENEKCYRVSKDFNCHGRTESFRSDQIYVYTDRGLYNPGDTILVRLIAWELLDDYKAIAGAAVTLFLQSPQGKICTAEQLVTNEFGIAAARLGLPQHMPEGDYEIVVLYNKARETARLRVERFLPPAIELTHTLARYLTPAQERLSFSVELSYFLGGRPGASTLKLSIINEGGMKIFSSCHEEQEPGVFRCELGAGDTASIKRQLSLEKPFKTVLEATDTHGQSCSVTRDMVYTAWPFTCVLEFDKDDYPAGETVQLLAKVRDLDGKPARGLSLICSIYEFHATIDSSTDENGIALFSFTMGNGPAYAVVTSPLMVEPLAREMIRFSAPKPMTSKVTEPPQREGIATHFTVHFSPDYVPVEKVIHVDFTDISGGIVTASTIPITRLSEDSHIAEGTVTAPTWGTMLANLYCCAVRKAVRDSGEALGIHNVGFITEGQHVTLHPDRELSITVKDFQPRVPPGSEALFEILVGTKDGGEAALGASLVDKAVLSLMDPFEVSPRDRFYHPQLKSISTGGAAVLTWPVVDRNWGDPWRDIAYSNWGFKDPGGRPAELRVRGAPAGMGEGSASFLGADFQAECGLEAPGGESSMDAAPMAAPMMECLPSADAPPVPSIPCKRSQESSGRKPAAPPKAITIRTRFPETSLWEPLLTTAHGKCSIAVKFPDSMTVQRLTLVATDREGGLGLVHKDIEVSQDLFIRPDMPAAMTLGDEIQIITLVKNNTRADAKVGVRMRSSGLEITGGESSLELGAGSEKALAWKVRASRCGHCDLTAIVQNEACEDRVEKKIFVRPPGMPLTETRKGELSCSAPFTAAFHCRESALYHTVFLNVSFPDCIPAIQAWDAIEELPLCMIGAAGVAGRVLCDCALLSWGEDRRGVEKQIAAVRERLQRSQSELLMAQNPDGSWGWFPSSKSDGTAAPGYLTSLVLKALCEMLDNNICLHRETLMLTIESAIESLWKSASPERLWSNEDACFWQVHAPDICWSLSAEIFETLVQAYQKAGKSFDGRLLSLKKRLYAHLRDMPSDPAFVAHAVRGLLLCGRVLQLAPLVDEMGAHGDFLLTLKRRGYWEPHWYHAYGGMVELNSLILELFCRLGRDRYESHIREIVTWLLSTRNAWGAWHNESGTGAAMRALLLAGAGRSNEIASRVAVKVNGNEVADLPMEGKDPLLSAARLRCMELTPYVKRGDNAVEVDYQGNLTARVTLEVKEWIEAPGESVGSEVLRISRQAPSQVNIGAPLAVTISLDSTCRLPLVRVIDSIPSNLSIDEHSLRELVDRGSIASFHIGAGEIIFSVLQVEGRSEISYRLHATRSGSASHSGTRAAVPMAGGPEVSLPGQTITVCQ